MTEDKKKRELEIIRAYVESMRSDAEPATAITVQEARTYGVVAANSWPLGGGPRRWYVAGELGIELGVYSTRARALLAGVGEVLTDRAVAEMRTTTQ